MIEQLKKLNSKIDILIALQMIEDKPKQLKEKIKLLSDLRVETAEIASILRVKSGHVSKEKSLLKNKK